MTGLNVIFINFDVIYLVYLFYNFYGGKFIIGNTDFSAKNLMF